MWVFIPALPHEAVSTFAALVAGCRLPPLCCFFPHNTWAACGVPGNVNSDLEVPTK